MNGLLHLDELPHHLLIDLQAPCRVDDDHAVTCAPCLVDALFRNLHDVLRRAVGIDRDVELLAERLEPVDAAGRYRRRRSAVGGTGASRRRASPRWWFCPVSIRPSSRS